MLQSAHPLGAVSELELIEGLEPVRNDEPNHGGGRLRIVVIDDDRDTADSLKTILELLGHDVRAVYSGHAGVQAALAVEADVVICDLAMPGMDGLRVVRMLRSSPPLGRTTFIAASGYGTDSDCAEAQSAGFHLHLLKPLDLPRLYELLAECSRRHSLAARK